MIRQGERRNSRRFEVNPVVCRCGPESGRQGLCVLRNVSVLGAYVVSPNALPPGSPIRLTFAAPPLAGYSLTGTVVRRDAGRPKGFAVRFEGPRPRLLRTVYHPADGN